MMDKWAKGLHLYIPFPNYNKMFDENEIPKHIVIYKF